MQTYKMFISVQPSVHLWTLYNLTNRANELVVRYLILIFFMALTLNSSSQTKLDNG